MLVCTCDLEGSSAQTAVPSYEHIESDRRCCGSYCNGLRTCSGRLCANEMFFSLSVTVALSTFNVVIAIYGIRDFDQCSNNCKRMIASSVIL